MSIPNTVRKKFMDGEIAFLTDTIKAMLLTNAHANDVDTQEFISDVSANEVSATGYTAGGATLASKTTTVDNTADVARADAADVTYSITGSMTARYVAVYKDTGTPGTSPVITILDFGSDKTVTDDDFIIQWNSNGIFTM